MLNLEAMNEAQRKAVMHGEGPLLVLAGPGSGKTFTITQRILYLIEVMQVPPEAILVITFTRDAAISMQRRFKEQSNRIYPVNFGTFHSVFYQILKTINRSPAKVIIGESQKKNLLLPILKKYHNENQWNPGDFLSAISFLKNTGNKEQTILKLPEESRSYFDAIFREYETARKQQNAMDFDDMVYECANILKTNSQFRNEWSRRFSHILMDETQDINPMQYEVVQLLSREPYNLFAVGDDDQAIYGFRGSKPACMQQFLEDYKAKEILLDINYRSYPDIVEASLKVISENKMRFSKKLKSCADNIAARQKEEMKDIVALHSFKEREEQYRYLTECLGSRTDKETCAVLFRTNMQMQSFATNLKRQGIPYEMKEKGRNIYEHFIVKDVMAYLRIAAGERQTALFIQILNKPARMLSREALWSENGMVSLERLKEYHTNEQAQKAVILLEKQLRYLEKTSPYLGVQYTCKIIGYEKYLEAEQLKMINGEERYEEWMQVLEWLKEDAKHYSSIKEWVDAQERYAEEMQKKDYSQNGFGTSSGKEKEIPPVQLMTVHASKGLEFDKVYIPDCNEKVFPHGAMPDRETCEEERRIFYVAMTRARKSLELLYLTGTKERPRLPSRFLNPLLN